MTIDRMTIIVENKLNHTGTIIINNESIFDCNLEWLEQYPCDVTGVSTSVHAIQWYGDHGEIELTTRGSNITITELGSLGIATSYFEQRKLEIEEEIRLAEQELLLNNTFTEDSYFDELLTDLLNSTSTEEISSEEPTE
jgi:hypothetical protein